MKKVLCTIVIIFVCLSLVAFEQKSVVVVLDSWEYETKEEELKALHDRVTDSVYAHKEQGWDPVYFGELHSETLHILFLDKKNYSYRGVVIVYERW